MFPVPDWDIKTIKTLIKNLFIHLEHVRICN